MMHSASAIRMFEAAVLLRRIMGTLTEFPVEYCRILLNMGDVFQCEDVELELSGEQKYWESAVRILGYFARHCIEMLGRGELNEEVPKKIVSFLSEGRKKKKKNIQLIEQYETTGIQVCVHWAVESLRKGKIQQDGTIVSPWLSGEQESGAVQLCKWLFEHGINQEAFDYKDPILLCRQVFPDKYRQIIDNISYRLWTDKYIENKEKITFCEVMLSSELHMEEWESLGVLKKERFEKNIWMPVLTMRLIALLKNEKVWEYENWYTEWKDEIAACISEEDAYGILFCLLVEILVIDIPERKMPQDFFRIILTVIRTIHNYTTEETIYYQYFLTECLIYARENYGLKTGAAAIGENLKELYGKRTSEKERELLAYCLARVKSEISPGMLNEICSILGEYWKKQCITGRHHEIVHLNREEWNPLTDFVLQENQGKFSAMRPVQNINRSFKKETRNLFRNPREIEANQSYVGIVTNEDDSNKRKEKTYAVHYGSGKREFCTLNAYYHKGEVVSVDLDDKGVPERLGKLAWKNDGRPLLADLLELSADSLKLRLPNKENAFVFEHKNWKRFHRLVNLWEPDTSMILQKGYKDSKKDSGEIAREVCYDKALDFYVPVERDFYRLIMEYFFSQSHACPKLRLVFIQESSRNGERGFLFSAYKGINYFLHEMDWEQRSFERLEEKLIEGDFCRGLIVETCLQEVGGHLVLALAEENPFEEKNWKWENYFSEEFFTIHSEKTEKENMWYADIDIPGMPRRVAASFQGFNHNIHQDVCNVQISEDGWNIRSQRHGEVKVEKLRDRSLKADWCTPARLNQLRELKPGDILWLENSRLFKARDGYHLMMTESNIQVFCAAESLSLKSKNLTKAMISKRACVVELVESKEGKAESEYEAIEIPMLDGYEGQLDGLISQFTEELNTASSDIAKISVGVWMKLDDKVVSAMVPVTAFESRPKALGVPVSANKTEDGKWLFKADIRKIQVRALWTVEDHKQDKRGNIFGEWLGRNLKIQGYGWRFVTQALESPVLHLWEEENIWKGDKGFICGIELGKGKISKVKRRNFPWETFPYAKYKDMVRLVTDGMEFYGDSDWGEFDDKGKGANWSVDGSVYLFKDENGTRYYDLRRNFYSRNSNAQQDRENRSEEQKKRLDEQYEKWINDGDYHILGAKFGDYQIQLKNLKVPQKIGSETLRDQWTDRVDLIEDDRTWVLGRYYPRNRVRALLIQKDDIWVASCHEAASFRVNDDLAREFSADSGEIIRRKLYYAGMDEENYLRFEWGYGFTFLVAEEDIVDEDGNKIGNNLFYGDMIEYFSMTNNEGEFGWRICVEYKAISRQIEWRVWDDSRKDVGIVQLLKIRRYWNPKSNKWDIRIEKVSVTERMIQQEAGLFNSWDFYEMAAAKLEDKSIDMLLEEEGYDKDTKIIFAQLKPDINPKHVTCLTFTYIPLNGMRGDTWLLEGRVAYMVAGDIQPVGQGSQNRNKLGNDYKISLYLPGELPKEKENPQMRVNVLRREFSVDESRLRTLYSKNSEKYYGCKMLVRLKESSGINNDTIEWKGNIISTPKRTKDSLKEWVESQEHCLVTLGIERKKQPLAEVAPGIISTLPPNAIQGSFTEGTLASLWIEDDELKAKTILPGDKGYLPNSGRPAELLIMDGTAKNYAKLQKEISCPGSLSSEDYKKTDEELNRNQFTVAGLPQLLVSDRETLERKISEPIPRLAYLSAGQKREKEQDMEIKIKEGNLFYAARLSLNQEDEPELHYFYPMEQVKEISWGEISFMDGTLSELADHVKNGQWHYHDRKTAFYDSKSHKIIASFLPDGKNYKEIVLFPNKEGRLRYHQKEFLKYGFPPREIIENGLPEDSAEYPVAGVTENSIWVEIFPGKLLEIPIEYLFAGAKKIPLSGLWTGMLFSGDKVCLCQDKGFAGNQKKLILKNVTFGSRAGFGKENTFFPIKELLNDCLILGSDLWPVILPVKGNEAWSEQKMVCISRDNKTLPLRHNQKLSAGDALLVDCSKSRLCVPGWIPLKLGTAYDDLWKNVRWLKDDLVRNDKNRWMKEFKLTLPMEINNIQVVNGVVSAWVFYSQPNTDLLPCGTKLCCICVGLRQGEQNTQEIVVRAGRTLLSIPVYHILPGIEKEKIVEVAKALRRERITFWLHKEDDGWYSGLRKNLEKEQLEIELLFGVDQAKGILCLTADNQALRWIPAKNASRFDRIDGRILWNALSERPKRMAKHLNDGTLSLIGTWQNEQKYEVLKTDGTRYRARPMEKAGTDKRGIHCFCAELYPMGDLICLYSETEYNCEKREPIPIEIGMKQAGCIIAFPYGMRRRTLHLTPWVYKALSVASDSDGFGKFDGLNLYRFRQEIPERFNKYRQIPEQANQDSKVGQLDYGLLRNHGRISEQLIYLYELVSKRRGEQLKFNEVFEFIRLTLKAWLEGSGKFLASGLDSKKVRGHIEEIDVAPSIAAILLLNLIKGDASNYELEQVAKPLSVHLTRMLGIGCGSTIHQELLLKLWILEDKKSGWWLRMNQISLRGENLVEQASEAFDGQLTPKQVQHLLGICDGVRIHALWDKDLELAVECILLSIGNLEECDTFYEKMWKKNCITDKMSIMGRILTPNAGSEIAGNNLYRDDIKFLERRLFALLRKDSVPLSLVSDTPIPITDRQKERGIELCRSFCRLVDRKREYANTKGRIDYE